MIRNIFESKTAWHKITIDIQGIEIVDDDIAQKPIYDISNII